MKRLTSIFVLAAAACGPQVPANTTSGGFDGGQSIASLRAAPPAAKTSVKVGPGIVTAVKALSKTNAGGFYMQDAAGGPQSGVWVYHGKVSTFDLPKVGDVVGVIGAYDVYKGQTELDGNSVTVLVLDSGHALPPAFAISDATQVAMSSSAQDAVLGQRITVTGDLSVLSLMPDELKYVGTMATYYDGVKLANNILLYTFYFGLANQCGLTATSKIKSVSGVYDVYTPYAAAGAPPATSVRTIMPTDCTDIQAQ